MVGHSDSVLSEYLVLKMSRFTLLCSWEQGLYRFSDTF